MIPIALSALRHWKLIGAGLLLLALGVQSYRLNSEQSAHEETRKVLGGERVAHNLFVERVRAQAERIRANMLERNSRIEAQQDQITREVRNDYAERIADLNRRAAALRLQLDTARRANPGRGGAGESPVPGTPGGTDGAPVDPGLSTEERIIATEQAIRLDELQKWIRRQLGVDRTN